MLLLHNKIIKMIHIRKLCKLNSFNKNFMTTWEILSPNIKKINVPRLCYKKINNNYYKNELFNKTLLGAGILTWLGFKKSDEDAESELIMTIKRSILLSQRGELAKAEQMLHIALRLAQEQQNSDGILYVYDLMANVALERGEIDKAETLFLNVLQRLLGKGVKQDDVKVIHISLKLARIYYMRGQIEKAEIGFKWCLDELEKNKIHDENIRALDGVVKDWYAKVLLDKGQYSESLKYLKEAYKVCCEIEGSDSEKAVLLLNDMGTAAWKMGDNITALNYLKQATQLGIILNDFDSLGVIYANLGLVYLEQGVLQEAKKYCKEGWNWGKKHKNTDATDQANYCFEQIRNHMNSS